LPWDDQKFSTRMLTEHLDDHHDMASRRGSLIDRHVAWLSTLAPDGHRVLDLGCGPGLYLERFGRAGWEGVGVDVSPAAIDHATQRASVLGIGCTYVHGDLRSTKVAGTFDLVLCVFGELNTFPTEDVRDVLDTASGAVSRGGRIAIEVSTRAGVAGKARRPVSWYTATGGLFADGPHVVLRESGWFEDDQAAVERWWVMDESTPRPRMFGSTTWFHYQLAEAIYETGLVVDGRFDELAGAATSGEGDFETLVLRRS
jgi:SAM-dependent methyltransferase